MKAAREIQNGLSASKFAAKWVGTYIILEAFDSDYYLISRPNLENYMAWINAKWLELHYLYELEMKMLRGG